MLTSSRRTKVLAAAAAGVVAAGITTASVMITLGGPPPIPVAAGAAAMAVREAARQIAPPLGVASVSPANGANRVIGGAPIAVTFTSGLDAASALPVISPAIPGHWALNGATAVFTPDHPFAGSTVVRVLVPGGVAGPRSDEGGEVPANWESSFTTRPYSVLRLQQILAELGYLPVSWRGPAVPAGGAQLAAAYSPPAGTFHWRDWYPASLRSLWRPGSPNEVDTGAITAFEADHGLTTDGIANTAVWADLLKAASSGGRRNTHGYSYAIASQAIPETLTIWHNGRQVFSSLTNTGISDRPTPIGTSPVYLKMPFQIMTGTNPDGSSYADPVQWVSYFNGGSAVHYFPRPGYGYPQSLGCVELPWDTAEAAYGYLPYGSLVTVTP